MDNNDGRRVRGISGISGLMLVAAALVSAVSSPAAAQSGAVLSGIVHDSTGIPVPGVVLTVIDPVQAETRVVVTNQRGAYFVDHLHYGREYAVHISHPRFRKSRVRASANEGDAPVDITLPSRRSRFARAVLLPLHVLFGLID